MKNPLRHEQVLVDLNPIAHFYSACFGGLPFLAGAHPVIYLGTASIGAVLGYNYGYSMGMQMNSDPNSNVLRGPFVVSRRKDSLVP